MEFKIDTSSKTTAVKLAGQFTFDDTHKFKNILNLVLENKTKSLNLDFEDITFVDSACMGMLLLLRDECEVRNISLNLHSPKGQVEKVFTISKFDELFSISKNS